MNIACITYRDWAKEIYRLLKIEFSDNHDFFVIESKNDFDAERLMSFNEMLSILVIETSLSLY